MDIPELWHAVGPLHLQAEPALPDLRRIEALMIEHGAAFDERRAFGVGLLYVPEGILDTGLQRLAGRDSISAHGARRDRDTNRTTRHLLANLRIFLPDPAVPAHAAAVSTAVIHEWFADRDGRPGAGLVVDYHDFFRRQPDGGWLFQSRAVRRLGAERTTQ